MHGGDHIVRAIEDVVDLLALGEPAKSLLLCPGEHRPAAIELDAEIGSHLTVRHWEKPDRSAPVVHDLGAQRTGRLATVYARTLRSHENQATSRPPAALKYCDLRRLHNGAHPRVSVGRPCPSGLAAISALFLFASSCDLSVRHYSIPSAWNCLNVSTERTKFCS
jgi:hypothetical protein